MYVNIYTHTHVYVHTYAYIYLHTHTRIHARTHTFVYICIYIYIYYTGGDSCTEWIQERTYKLFIVRMYTLYRCAKGVKRHSQHSRSAPCPLSLMYAVRDIQNPIMTSDDGSDAVMSPTSSACVHCSLATVVMFLSQTFRIQWLHLAPPLMPLLQWLRTMRWLR